MTDTPGMNTRAECSERQSETMGVRASEAFSGSAPRVFPIAMNHGQEEDGMDSSSTTLDQPAIPAEAEPRTVRFLVALNGYEPWHRSYREEIFTATEYTSYTSGDRCYRLEVQLNAWKDATDAFYLVDDGRTVRPMYVIGYQPGGPSPLYPNGTAQNILIAPFPTEFTHDGKRIERADGRGPVDFQTWTLGPRRAYHLKMNREDRA